MRLKDKVAIVTGAASGMGAATARLFAREGARVVVADLLEAEGAAVAKEICDAGGEARFRRLDVTGDADWTALVAETAPRWRSSSSFRRTEPVAHGRLWPPAHRAT